ncbi:GNAT family N-acetyltransferase [Ralstonia pseudosolanacearum]|uniref:Acetyltransferase protein n=2 Tax=Ralstonia solanacearum species complex TaxID=3116862 RepID=Q8XYI4_RALN1|nr:GNAT family N-acetyltransferase [Ralstonia pseudosolanacearum]CUV45873.1 putative acetyltransferase protein [Ralstonia solanacearum]AST27351.1 GNAT family N-acetyltransferase [Ralstonia pseudosolanacearum]MDC6283747.1 GNAT family N-acetyltransferase [Ralstonia pseudosolanacearum]MDC6294195.1 GNAT family N-acetyltransferase [Ralstonia pseudosolanacearum]MDD7791445.1 GNAT family N-acetyltransferase [Ralstonia pseudosolanacearum]
MTPPESAHPPATVQVDRWDALRDEAGAVRYDVFVIEQNVPVELEWDDDDARSWHAVARDASGRAVATGRLLPDGHIGRMAVRKEARGTGIGARVLQALIDKARALGYTQLILNAQTHAMPFYARAGFTPEGDEFEEAGIAHRTMRRVL